MNYDGDNNENENDNTEKKICNDDFKNDKSKEKREAKENLYRKKIKELYIYYYENYIEASPSNLECFYCLDNISKNRKSLIYLKDVFNEYLKKKRKKTNLDNNFHENQKDYDIKKFIYFLSSEEEKKREKDNDKNTIEKNDDMNNKLRFIYSKLLFKGIKGQPRIYIIKSYLFSRNDRTIEKCSNKVKNCQNITDEIEIEYIGRYNEMINYIVCKFECNHPYEENGYRVYNIAIVDTENLDIKISQPFSTMSHRQFFVRKDKSFIGKIDDINMMEYYYNGFCENNLINENSVIFKKEFKFELKFFYYENMN